MRKRAGILVPLMTFSLAWVLGCQGQDPVSHTGEDGGREPVAGREKAFEADLLALKAREQDPGRLEMGARELVARHGFAVPKDFRKGRTETGMAGTAGAVQEKAGLPLAKAAGFENYLVKDYTDPISGTFSQVVTVPLNATLTVETKRQGSTDPAIIAYFLSSGTDSAHAIGIVGMGNDEAGLDAKITWTNSKGAQMVRFVVFSPLAATVGTADVTVKVGANSAQVNAAVPVAGRVYAVNNLVPNPGPSCPNQVQSGISGSMINPPNGSSALLLGVNAMARTGMEVIFGYPRAGVTQPLSESLGGFLVVFQPMSRIGIPLIDRSARVTQENGYKCD